MSLFCSTKVIRILVISLSVTACGRYEERVWTAPPSDRPTTTAPTIPPPDRVYLENSLVKVGIDLNAGGAITFLSDGPTGENMVNNFDLGRQIQTSLYSGPVPYAPNGKQPIAMWAGLGYNPVQTGDIHGNPSLVLSHRRDSVNRFYVKTAPLIWPLNEEPAECVMEHWYILTGNVLHVRSRTQFSRKDTTQYEARTQESPCMYLNGPYTRFIAYTGTAPFTNDGTSEFAPNHGITDRYTTENWMALRHQTTNRGVGIYRAGEVRFISAFIDKPGIGGERDHPTGYVTAAPFAIQDYNGMFDYEYDIIVGSLADIRTFAYRQPRLAPLPNFRFAGSRQGWHYANTRDGGWPIPNDLRIRWGRADSTRTTFQLKSPESFWRAADLPKLYIQAAFQTSAAVARFVWRRPGDDEILPRADRFLDFPIVGDGQMRVYEIALAGRPGWEGIIQQIGIEPVSAIATNVKTQQIRLRSVTASRP